MQFQKESKIINEVQGQNTIEEAHRCLVKTIFQAAEKIIPRDEEKTAKELEREERIARVEYRKHHRDLTNTTKLRS